MVSNDTINLFLFLMGNKRMSNEWTMETISDKIVLRSKDFDITFEDSKYTVGDLSVQVDEFSDITLSRFNIILREKTIINR